MSQSTVNKLTQPIRELQKVLNSLSESQDCKDLETASSSGLTRAPGIPSVIPSFFQFAMPGPATSVSTSGTKFARCLPAVQPPSPVEQSSPLFFEVNSPSAVLGNGSLKKSPRWRHSSTGEGASRQKCVLVPLTLRKQRVGLKQYRKLFSTFFSQATGD